MIDLARACKMMSVIGVVAILAFMIFPPVDGSAEAQEREIEAINAQLDAWCDEYDLDRSKVVFGGYKDLPDSFEAYDGIYTVAWTIQPGSHVDEYGSGDRNVIEMDTIYKDGRFTWDEKCTLWHEFCHVLNWYLDGNPAVHGDEFHDRLWEKPQFAIGEEVSGWSTGLLRYYLR